MDRCKKLGIKTNERVYARTQSSKHQVRFLTDIPENLLKCLYCSGLTQSTLEGTISRRPKPPTFTTDGLLNYIIELVVSEDEVS